MPSFASFPKFPNLNPKFTGKAVTATRRAHYFADALLRSRMTTRYFFFYFPLPQKYRNMTYDVG